MQRSRYHRISLMLNAARELYRKKYLFVIGKSKLFNFRDHSHGKQLSVTLCFPFRN